MGGEALIDLRSSDALEPRRVGTKAAALARLIQAGLQVPDGHVIPADLLPPLDSPEAAATLPALHSAIGWLSQCYAGVSLAVRSSALAEDLPEASFAGQYDSVLDVTGRQAIEAAVQRCRASAVRVSTGHYRARQPGTLEGGFAVVVQRLVQPEVAGVALGADPVTGDSSKVVVCAVRGSGVNLVSGHTCSEDWEVTADAARPRGGESAVLTEQAALAVGALVRRAEEVLGHPQDIEWAIVDGAPCILQARPMTAVPPSITWTAPARGGWFRGIRLGELLPEPVTPLFATWLLDCLERQFAWFQNREGGFTAPQPWHVLVHGWYFHSPVGSARQTLLVRGLLRRPRLAIATLIAPFRPDIADRLFFASRAAKWQEEVLGSYRKRVADAGVRMAYAEPADLPQIIDGLARAAGDFYWSLVLFGGVAWRAEVALARFCRRHLAGTLGSHQLLLSGLAQRAAAPAHAVYSLDWIRAGLGDTLRAPSEQSHVQQRMDSLVAERSQAEARCFEALAAKRRRRAQLRKILTAAQRYAVLRHDHGWWFTLAWPLMRESVLRLGSHLQTLEHLEHAEDVFFLTRAELDACLSGQPPPGLDHLVPARRETWEHQGRLSPPLLIGKPPMLIAKLLLATPRFLRAPAGPSSDTLNGVPASPGIATGHVRIVRDLSAVDSALAGEVLVVAVASPAITPLLERVTGLCVDGGSVAAHASLIAREYGIPAVVGLGDASHRLRDGVLVTVDGNAGTVRIH